MYKEVNLKEIRTITVTADGGTIVNPVVESSAIIKSFDTAKRIAVEALEMDKATAAATVVVGLEARKQYYYMDDAIFFEHAVPCDPPRARRDDEEAEEE